jgi:hypothetical protein
MKKILMAAVAVSALSAGAASAATISNTTQISGRTIAGTAAGTFDPYTIANELNVATPPTADATIVVSPTTNTTIGQGQYVLTYNITGGTFTTTSINSGSLGLVTNTALGANIVTPSSVVSSVNTVNANTVSFNVTIASGEFLTTATLTDVLKLGSARATVAVNGSITTAAGNAVDGGTIASQNLIDYRSGYKFAATANNGVLTLASSYKAFTVGANATSFAVGSAMGFALNTGTDARDIVMKTAGTTGAAAAVADLLTPVLTLTGDVASFDPTVGAQAPDTTTTNVFTLSSLTAIRAGSETVNLSQHVSPAIVVAGNPSSYAITPVVTMAAGYTAPAFATTALGSVSLEGTNFYAAWVGDGTNGINYTIRLGNRAATAVTGITVTALNSLNAVSTATCTVGTLPASGELLITSAALKTCFGSFGRADLRITAQATSTTMTAKLRSSSAGVVNEQSLGGGTVSASAQ